MAGVEPAAFRKSGYSSQLNYEVTLLYGIIKKL